MGEDFFEGLDEVRQRLKTRGQSTDRWRILYELSSLFNSPIYNFDEILHIILDEVIRLTKADRGFLMLYNERDELEVKLARNMNYETLSEEDRQVSRSIVEEVIASEQGICVTNIADDKKWSEMSSIIKLKILSVICVPLKVSVAPSAREDDLRRVAHLATRKILGVIYVDSQTLTTTFTDEDLELVQAMANNATTAILNAKLYQEATTDSLTGVQTRRFFERRLVDEIKLAQKSHSPLGLLLLDVDNLKATNRSRGYSAGDEALIQIARAIKAGTRRLDVVARYGGDEFILAVPQTDAQGAEEVARKILNAAHGTDAADEYRVTVSIGVAGLRGNVGEDAPEKLVKRGDQALYEAKRTGGGKYIVWSPKLKDAKRTDKLAGVFSGEGAKDYRNVLMLLDAIPTIHGTTSLETLNPLLVDVIVDVTQADRGILALTNEKNELTYPVARDKKKRDIEPEDYSHSVIDRVIKTQTPICIVASPGDEDATSRSMERLDIRAVMCVPLAAKDAIVGAIYVDTHTADLKTFDETTLGYLDAIARHAAIAIENAKLYGEVQKRQRKIEKLTHELEGRVAEQETALERVEVISEDEVLQRKRDVEHRYSYENIIGQSPPMQRLFRLLDRITDSNVEVFIHGESGTGKELVAKAIHYNGPRKSKRFVAENCAAMTETLLEAELFGHMKGSFTGAQADRKGLFELADGGTLFLDEVGDMTLNMQKKLLRVLEERVIRRVGGKDIIPVDVRVISASNKDLKKLVAGGEFREDLYYRLNVVRVDLPPLRKRREDLPPLVEHFLKAGTGIPKKMSREAMDLLNRYSWPGNIRELRNVIERAKIISDGDMITEDHIILDTDFGLAPGEPTRAPGTTTPEDGGGPKAKDILAGIGRESTYFELNERQRKLLEHLEEYGSIKNRDYYEIMKVSKSTGWRDLKELIDKGIVEVHGRGKGSVYSLAESAHAG